MTTAIKISNVEIDTIENTRCVTFSATVNGVTVNDLLEWVRVCENDEGKFLNCEDVDSHLSQNQSAELKKLGVEAWELRHAVNAEIYELA